MLMYCGSTHGLTDVSSAADCLLGFMRSQGYSFSFRYTGDFVDKSERDSDGTVGVHAGNLDA